MRHSEEGLESATGICRKARQRNAARRSPVESPEKSQTHPLPRAAAHSPAVGSAHSSATPQAIPCPRARNAPSPKDTPETPHPRTTATFPGPKGREAPNARHGCAVRHSEEALESAAGICREAR